MEYLISFFPYYLPIIVSAITCIYLQKLLTSKIKFLIIFSTNSINIFISIFTSYFIIPVINNILFNDYYQYIGFFGFIERSIFISLIYFLLFKLFTNIHIPENNGHMKLYFIIFNCLLIVISWEVVGFLQRN